MEEIQSQNQALLRALDDLQRKQQELVHLNRELEDTNRGVVALYAELDERADHLRRADELKTRFLSNMTHEFRTPVNSILALTRLLTERLGVNPDHKDELFYIRKSAQQLADLVDDLLDIAKVEAGKIEIRPAAFEVASLFGALRGMLRPLLVNQSVALHFETPEDVPPIYSDESKVSQILRNFISNALKYTERGEVRVSARVTPQRDGVEFTVADTGIGIPVRRVRADREPAAAPRQGHRPWTAAFEAPCRAARRRHLRPEHAWRGIDVLGHDPDGVSRRQADRDYPDCGRTHARSRGRGF
jgi:signal transduction histidine kinase